MAIHLAVPQIGWLFGTATQLSELNPLVLPNELVNKNCIAEVNSLIELKSIDAGLQGVYWLVNYIPLV